MQMHRNMLQYLRYIKNCLHICISCVFVDLDNKHKPLALQEHATSTDWFAAKF